MDINYIITNLPFRPDYSLLDNNITKLDIGKLQKLGIRGLILDLDNTIMLPRAGIFSAEMLQWLTNASQVFQIYIVSNNKYAPYIDIVQKYLDTLGLNIYFMAYAKKPSPKNLQKALDTMGVEAHETMIVGDRVWTDILGGMHMGMHTLLVTPLIGQAEVWWKRYARLLETATLGQPRRDTSEII